MASLFFDIQPSKDELTFFRDGNCIIIACGVSAYSLWQIVLRVIAEGKTKSSDSALYDRCHVRFWIVFNRVWELTNRNMR
jgi:hypothetical protein